MFLALRDLMRSSKKVFIEGSLVSSPTAEIYYGMVERQRNAAEINSSEILFKKKGAGISCFCQRRVSALEDPEKRKCVRIFDHKLTEEII